MARTNNSRKKSKRGFASMRPELQRQIAREGGIAAHRSGNAHQWTPQEASAAGKKGGRVRRKRRLGEDQTAS